MRKLLTRWNVALGVAAVSMFAFAGSAFAAAGDPPTFDASTLGPKINDFATALLAGVVILLGVVLIAIVPFVLVRMGIRYIKRWFGAGKATAAV
jgi:hypothetical protein